MGGEPPEDEKSELLLGERDRFSGTDTALSSHCWGRVRADNREAVEIHTEGRPPRVGLTLSGDGVMLRGLYGDWAEIGVNWYCCLPLAETGPS